MFRNFNKLHLKNNKNLLISVIRNNSTKLTLVTEENGIRNIILNNPKTRNALSLEMVNEIHDSITKNINDVCLRAIVLSSSESVFSGGHNLKDLTVEKGEDYLKQVFQKTGLLMMDIMKCPVPVIAKVDGIAAAAGCQIISHCDIVVCSDKSTFSTPGVNFGIFCSTPGIAVARTMSRMKASHMLLTGLPLTAQEAYIAGLVSKVVPAVDLDKELMLICNAIKMKSRPVIALGKKFFYEQIHMDVTDAYQLGCETMVSNLHMKDGREGIKSFIEKRKPVWSHDEK